MLETKHLFLRPIETKDSQFLIEMYQDPEVMRSIYDGNIFDLDFSKKRISGFLEHWKKYGFGMYIMLEKSSDQAVGYCGFRHFELPGSKLNDHIEIGYIIHPTFWGKGYASEASAICIQAGFEQFHFSTIIATIIPSNLSSQHVAAKVGMSHKYDLKIKKILHSIYEITDSEYSLLKCK